MRRVRLNRVVVLAVALALVVSVAACARATTITYDPAVDLLADLALSTPTSPYGVWSYVYKSSPTSSGVTELTSLSTESALPGWRNTGGSDPDCAVTHNPGGNIGSGSNTLNASYIYEHPYRNSTTDLTSAFRWTAPSAGTINVSMLFYYLQSGANVTFGIALDNVVLTSGTIASQVTTPSGGLSVTNQAVNAGDVVDLYVRANLTTNPGDWVGGPASIAFTAVPEPGTLALLAAGLAGLLCYAWRKRR